MTTSTCSFGYEYWAQTLNLFRRKSSTSLKFVVNLHFCISNNREAS